MKRAFSLIEVVFAIVIIAISMMSVPMLLKQSSKSDENSIIQEGILAASTKMGNILSYPWDGNSYDSTNKVLRVLDVKNGDSELSRLVTLPVYTNDNNLRKGHIYADRRRKFFDYKSFTSVFPSTAINILNPQSINDFFLASKVLGDDANTTNTFDYKDTSLKMTTSVYYVSDSTDYSKKKISISFSTPMAKFPVNSNVNSTNIKMIELNTTSPLLNNRTFILRTFICNIGQAGLLERSY